MHTIIPLLFYLPLISTLTSRALNNTSIIANIGPFFRNSDQKSLNASLLKNVINIESKMEKFNKYFLQMEIESKDHTATDGESFDEEKLHWNNFRTKVGTL